MSSRCSSCDAPIIWAVTDAGKRMPLDAEPAPDGNVVLTRVGGQARARKGSEFGPNMPRHKSHFATCPNANQHRGKGKS